ncbi:hypothetical protein H696_05591 [Fonticula alba]|uniref:Uncharacterized protein n=1 Tax=Fonticula alba TaxID=691883 RepID=A0A058Z144_FONAL|nr:hypothetical protein H696_05591 [Fonticula alba]KCV67861.1 hypothetical protein H696_05591 [Fonticula alba]|eukprot:XP_009497681.1 hypothetical protein H696_05591 [Fonticula alba]
MQPPPENDPSHVFSLMTEGSSGTPSPSTSRPASRPTSRPTSRPASRTASAAGITAPFPLRPGSGVDLVAPSRPLSRPGSAVPGDYPAIRQPGSATGISRPTSPGVFFTPTGGQPASRTGSATFGQSPLPADLEMSLSSAYINSLLSESDDQDDDSFGTGGDQRSPLLEGLDLAQVRAVPRRAHRRRQRELLHRVRADGAGGADPGSGPGSALTPAAALAGTRNVSLFHKNSDVPILHNRSPSPPPRASALQQLTSNRVLRKSWYNFCKLPEAQQNRIINFLNTARTAGPAGRQHRDLGPSEDLLPDSLEARFYCRLTRSTRQMLLRGGAMLLATVSRFEVDVIALLWASAQSPPTVPTLEPQSLGTIDAEGNLQYTHLDSRFRKIIHAIASFHSLLSKSSDADDKSRTLVVLKPAGKKLQALRQMVPSQVEDFPLLEDAILEQLAALDSLATQHVAKAEQAEGGPAGPGGGDTMPGEPVDLGLHPQQPPINKGKVISA